MKSKVTLAFKKDDYSSTAMLIKWWTKSKYAHVELIMGNSWISSSGSTGGLHINELKPLKDNWDYIDVEVDDKLEEVMKFAKSQQGTGYDYVGIFGIVVNHNIQRKNRWFCSEICTRLLQEFDEPKSLELKPNLISPEDLYVLYKG